MRPPPCPDKLRELLRWVVAAVYPPMDLPCGIRGNVLLRAPLVLHTAVNIVQPLSVFLMRGFVGCIRDILGIS